MDENDDDADIRNAAKLLVAGQPVTAPDPDEEPAPDAMRLPDWPMKLALGWIMTRSANFVGELLQTEPDALLDLDVRHTLFRANGGAGISRGEAAAELWAALSEGRLTGSAIIDGARAEIAPIQWQDFRLAEGSGRLGSPQGHIVLAANNEARELGRPSFRRDDMRRIWPAASESQDEAIAALKPAASATAKPQDQSESAEDQVQLTLPQFHLYRALVEEFGKGGGYGTATPVERRARAALWRGRLNPSPLFPESVERAIRHLDRNVFGLGLAAKRKGT